MAIALCLLPRCGGHTRAGERVATGERPAAALASSPDAQASFRPLLKRFARSSDAERAALEPELRRFRQAYGTDPLARLAEAFLGWIALSKNDLGRAEALARNVEAGDAGTVRDLGLLIHGAAYRRRGNVGEALEHLRPLVGKLIDGYARALLSDEITQAALAAKLWAEAVHYMTTWLREAGEGDQDKNAVRERIAKLLDRVPPPVLVKLFEAQPATGGGEASQQGDMRELIAQRLAQHAREQKDVGLAKELLTTSGALLGAQGDAVAELAVGSGGERIEGRTIGLLVSTRTDETRRRGLEVASGLAQGLGLPGSDARLVTRDDRGAAEHRDEALQSLLSEGAAILVAGVDEDEATAVAAFARAHHVGAVLLRAPKAAAGAPAGADVVFVLGESPGETGRLLAAALQGAGADPVAVLGDGFLEAQLAPAAPSHKPLLGNACGDVAAAATWRRVSVQGIVLNGSPACARDALAAMQDAGVRARIALGLDAGGARTSAGSWTATAGLYPIDAHTTSATLKAWLASGRAAPSWWAGLGHDAGVLTWAAIQKLPEKGTEERKEVLARRDAAIAALGSATAELWTTEAGGFGGARAMPRQIAAKRVGSP